MDGFFAPWAWRPEVVTAVKQGDLKDILDGVELRLPPEWEVQLTPNELFFDNNEILKQMESLINGAMEQDDWMEPVPLNIT